MAFDDALRHAGVQEPKEQVRVSPVWVGKQESIACDDASAVSGKKRHVSIADGWMIGAVFDVRSLSIILDRWGT